ncbi:MAG TPA: methyltransferase domain-containing protein [Nitrospinota bacterium]|jgi:SAM-dependent methyltransferase|nr:methyltransferase domain-containing protein [Nitrospinota bacterium]
MSFFSPPPQRFQAELLDLDDNSFEEARESLEDVRRVNKYLSGYRVLLRYAGQFLRDHREDRPFTILDLATGSGDQPVALAKLAHKLKVPVKITAIDINYKMLKCARIITGPFPEIALVQCDILSWPFCDDSFDLVVNSLSLHHFSRENAVKILCSMRSLSRCGFIINDLHRSRVAYGSIFLLTRIFTKNRLTRHDAPVSVMNAFTPKEIRDLAREAGLDQFQVYRHFPYRIALVVKMNKVCHEKM